MKFENYPFILWIVLLAKAISMIAFIQYTPIGLGPDEAQYWTWSERLDWGYYSKPPGIAWQIRAGTEIFGDTEFGVRFGAVVLGTLLPLAVYLLADAATGSGLTALYAAIAMAITPIGVLATFFSITDTGITFFWVLACWTIVVGLKERRTPNYALTGLFVALAALFKWPAFAFWAIIIFLLPFFPTLRSRKLIVGILVSLIGLLPSIYWNWTHDWASFRHVWATVVGQEVHHGHAVIAMKPNFFEFLGAQFALISPVLFILLAWAMYKTYTNSAPTTIRFLGMTFLTIMGICIGLSLIKKIQGNWGSYAYPSAIVVMAWYCCEKMKNGERWLQWGMLVSVILVAIALSIPTLQRFGVSISHNLNPFKHNVGWERLDEELTKSGYDPEKHFLFGDKYQTASLLSFYGPKQKPAYFFNLSGTRKNQFSYWQGMVEEQVGNDGFFVLTENCPVLTTRKEDCINFYQDQLKPYFQEVKFISVRPLYEINGEMVKAIFIFQGINYNGQKPPEYELY